RVARPPSPRRRGGRACAVRGPRSPAPPTLGAPRGVREGDRDRVPGPDDVAPPDAVDRPAARGAPADPSRAEPLGRAEAGGGAARGRAHPGSGERAPRVPAPV